MTNPELSNEFDVLFNNITSNQAPGVNEYEKSVFLTKAQLQLVNEYFNNRIDVSSGGFDGNQKRQYDFSTIIKVEVLQAKQILPNTEEFNALLNPHKSKVFLFPKDYFLALNEVITDNKKQYSVIPLNYAEYQKLLMKPYSYPVKKTAWRIITGKTNDTAQQPIVEVIGRFEDDISYRLRYVKKLSPIILEDLKDYGEDITIGGLSTKTPCELPEETHQEILERAVALAKIAWLGSTSTQVQAKE
jgi:hypothetical protein